MYMSVESILPCVCVLQIVSSNTKIIVYIIIGEETTDNKIAVIVTKLSKYSSPATWNINNCFDFLILALYSSNLFDEFALNVFFNFYICFAIKTKLTIFHWFTANLFRTSCIDLNAMNVSIEIKFESYWIIFIINRSFRKRIIVGKK